VGGRTISRHWEKYHHILTKLTIAIDILSNHLPFLFIQPLPKSILSPKIELRLFPSTYPSFPAFRLPKILYRTLFRSVRWLAPVFLHRSLRSFGKPSGVKGIGLEITCLRVIKIENGRRIEARWRTASSPWSPSAPTNTAEAMPRTWSGWFYFDINRQGMIVRHVVENVNNQRNVEGEHNLKDILVRTVSNGKRFADGLGAVQVDKKVVQRDGSILRRLNFAPRIFPEPSPSNIFASARTYCSVGLSAIPHLKYSIVVSPLYSAPTD
jgi:Mitochondrial protein up-regulated during meiosis